MSNSFEEQLGLHRLFVIEIKCFSSTSSRVILWDIHSHSAFKSSWPRGRLSTKTFQGTNPTARSPQSNIKRQWQQLLRQRCHYSSFCSVCVDLLPTGMWAHRNHASIFITKALQCHRVSINAVETTPWKHIKRAVAHCPTQNNPRAFALAGCVCR